MGDYEHDVLNKLLNLRCDKQDVSIHWQIVIGGKSINPFIIIND